MDDLLLVQGLRPKKTGEYAWQRVLRDRLRHRHADLRRGVTTKVAEDGLGLPRSAYWFVHRSAPAFGRIAVVWRSERLDGLRSTSGSTPFDTGGVWFQRIKTRPEMTEGRERADFVADASCAVSALAQEFASWLASAHPDDPVEYVLGRAPKAHVEGIVLDESVNNSHAWSWELRIAVRDVSSSVLMPSEIYWTKPDYEAFESWIHDEDDALSARERTTLLGDCLSMSRFDPDPSGALFERLCESCG